MTERTCNAAMKRGGKCKLNHGHSGHHRYFVWYCDMCGQPRTGSVVGRGEDGMLFCLPCIVRIDRRGYIEEEMFYGDATHYERETEGSRN